MILCAMLFGLIQNCGQVQPDEMTSQLYVVSVRGQYGYIDRTGNLVIGVQFSGAGQFREGLAPASVDLKRDRYGYIDSSGRFVVQPVFKGAMPFSEGLAAVRVGDSWGYINQEGRIVIAPTYHSAESFKGGVALVKTTTALASVETLLDAEVRTRDRYIRADGRPISDDAPGPFDVLLPYSAQHLTPFSITPRRKTGFLDRFGNWKIDPKFDGVRPFSEGLALVEVKGQYGFIDDSGRLVIRPTFQSARSFSEGRAAAKKKDRWGVIDANGMWIVEPIYGEVFSYKEGLAPFRLTKPGKMGYIDRAGRVVIPPRFDHARDFSDGIAEVVVNRKSGYIDTSGAFIWDPEEN